MAEAVQRRCRICRKRMKVTEIGWRGVTLDGFDSWEHDECHKRGKK